MAPILRPGAFAGGLRLGPRLRPIAQRPVSGPGLPGLVGPDSDPPYHPFMGGLFLRGIPSSSQRARTLVAPFRGLGRLCPGRSGLLLDARPPGLAFGGLHGRTGLPALPDAAHGVSSDPLLALGPSPFGSGGPVAARPPNRPAHRGRGAFPGGARPAPADRLVSGARGLFPGAFFHVLPPALGLLALSRPPIPCRIHFQAG